MSKINVAASVVREWAVANLDKIADDGHKCLSDNARGRLHPEVVTAFNRSHRTKQYGVGTKVEKTVKVLVSPDASEGRKTPRTVTMPISEVRSLAGVEGRRGRISKQDQLAAALIKITQ